MTSSVFLECKCSEPKTHRLTFDGGSLGFYTIALCKDCYVKEQEKFQGKGKVTFSEITPFEEKI